MPKVYEGKLVATGMSFVILVSRWNSFITERLLEGAIDALVRHGASEDKITIVRVPGAYELPIALGRVLESKGIKPSAVIVLGALIRGGTIHFDLIAGEVFKGVASQASSSKVPVSIGVLTTDNIEQAIERAGSKAGNKGWEAAVTAIEMADLYKSLPS